MRVLFATTGDVGHFTPLVPFARACAAGGHEVRVVGPSAAARLAERAGLPFESMPEPSPDAVAAVTAGVRSAPPADAIRRAVSELYVGCYARTALPDGWPRARSGGLT